MPKMREGYHCGNLYFHKNFFAFLVLLLHYPWLLWGPFCNLEPQLGELVENKRWAILWELFILQCYSLLDPLAICSDLWIPFNHNFIHACCGHDLLGQREWCQGVLLNSKPEYPEDNQTCSIIHKELHFRSSLPRPISFE